MSVQSAQKRAGAHPFLVVFDVMPDASAEAVGYTRLWRDRASAGVDIRSACNVLTCCAELSLTAGAKDGSVHVLRMRIVVSARLSPGYTGFNSAYNTRSK